MVTLKHTIGLINLNSVDQVIRTLNSLPSTTCTIIEKKITSVTLSIEMDHDTSLEDVLALGTLIGTIQTSSLM